MIHYYTTFSGALYAVDDDNFRIKRTALAAKKSSGWLKLALISLPQIIDGTQCIVFCYEEAGRIHKVRTTEVTHYYAPSKKE